MITYLITIFLRVTVLNNNKILHYLKEYKRIMKLLINVKYEVMFKKRMRISFIVHVYILYNYDFIQLTYIYICISFYNLIMLK